MTLRTIDRRIISWIESQKREFFVWRRVQLEKIEKYLIRNKIIIELGFILMNALLFVLMMFTIIALSIVVSKCNCI